jgi:hypothetical protein
VRRRAPEGRYRVGPDLTGVGAVLAALIIVAFLIWVATQVSGLN